MTMDVSRFVDIIGRALPGGDYHISAEENDLLCRTLGTVPAPDGSAHPIYAYIATQSAMGLTVDELLAIAEFQATDGPMLGSVSTNFYSPLTVDATYHVQGYITNLTRKKGKSIGTMDLLEFRLTLSRPGGERVLDIANVWILPRGHADD